MKKLYIFAVMAMSLLTVCAQQKYEQGKPNDPNYRYLDEYRPLKEYINKEQYPNFKLGIGTTVNDYLNNSTFKGLVNDNFTETVAGNAMKMASCVDGNGNMNFSTVTRYVEAAEKAGINVYGHTLAWHSQQANAWLRSLIKDKTVASDGSTTQPSFQTIVVKDFTKASDQNIGWSSSMADNGFSISYSSTNGMQIHTTKKCTNFWDVQFLAITGLSIEQGVNYRVTMHVRATAVGDFHTKLGSWSDGITPNVPFTTEWKDVIVNYNDAKGGDFYMLQCGDFVGDIYVKSITIEEEVAGQKVPMTQAEKLEALTGAMDKWIKGMMDACGGKVKAWDVVNEAIGGDGNDGEGNYNLQHAKEYKPGINTSWDVGGDAFYWQDHMGDLEYVRTAVRLARKYGPEDIKLFINDYNLESTWDGNKKLQSLIGWIKKWEADGETRIDGIGTQMHISYYLDKTSQDNQKKAITKMFELMAASGKLVRVSEMDMGICDRQFGTAKKTSDVTEAEHKLMADYYEWIIKEYFRLIPPAQQWGICQWCPTDGPGALGTGWRGGEPVGIWDLNYYRKHVYAGFVRGLGGVAYDGIEQIETERQVSADAIYDIRGNMYPVGTSLQSLPSGIYIIGDRKIKK